MACSDSSKKVILIFVEQTEKTIHSSFLQSIIRNPKKRLYALAPAAAHLPPPPVDQDEENEDEAMARYTDTNLNSVLFVPTCLPADVAAMEQDDERAAVLVDMNDCRVSRTVLASLSSFAVDWVEDIVAYIRQKRLE